MERDPEARAGAGRTAGEGDLGLIEVPLLGLTAGELEGAGGVIHRTLHRRDEAVGGRVLDRTVFDRDDRDAGVEGWLEQAAHDRPVAAAPAAAMDIEEQGRGLVGLRAPEVDPLHPVRAIGHVFVRLDRQRVFTELWVAGLDGRRRGRLRRSVRGKEGADAQGQGDDGGEQGVHTVFETAESPYGCE